MRCSEPLSLGSLDDMNSVSRRRSRISLVVMIVGGFLAVAPVFGPLGKTLHYLADFIAERPQPIEHYFHGVRERIAPTRPGALQFARRVDYDVQANWKVYVDNYLEGYHIPYVHPELLKLYADYQSYRTEVSDWYSVQVGPLQQERNVYTAGGGEALYYQIFPNLMLNVVPGRLQSNVVIPVAADRCKVIFRYYYDDVTSAPARERIEADVAFSDKVQREDAEICERVQQGLGSRAYDKGRFSVRFEEGVYHFQKLLKHAYRAWLKR